MSYNRSNKNRNYLLAKQDQHDNFRFCLHRARVTDVYIDEGTVNVEFEDIPYSVKVKFPLVGLSMPPKKNADDSNEKRSSWGRYIPQQGDVIIVGFGPSMQPYAVGYSTVFYEGFEYRDKDNESTGGIGWGAGSARQLKPGDWDFRASRGAALYLGDKAVMSSGSNSFVANKSTGDATIKSTLVINKYGTSSETRQGEARRKLLPTDSSETTIYNLTGQVAQESTDIIRSGFPQIELARTSMGDVIDETIFQIMASTLGGVVVRRYEAVKDSFGVTDVYYKKVDNLGNFEVAAPTAVLAQWLTPAATWNITNATTAITSSTSFSVTSPLINLNAATGAVINSPNVQLGGPTAAEFLVKGTSFKSALDAFLGSVITATATVGTTPQNAAALTQIGIHAATFLSAISSMLSVKVKTE